MVPSEDPRSSDDDKQRCGAPITTPEDVEMNSGSPLVGWDPDSLKTAENKVEGIYSDDAALQLSSAKWFCKELAEQSAPFARTDWLVKRGVVPRLVGLLIKQQDGETHAEVMRVLTSIVAGASGHIDDIFKANALPALVTQLRSPALDVRMQAVWIIGSIADHSSYYRDVALLSGTWPLLLKMLSEEGLSQVVHIRTAAWALLNLCKGEGTKPPWVLVSQSLPTWRKLLNSIDDEIVLHASQAISHLSDRDGLHLEPVIESGVCPRLITLLTHHSPAVQAYAMSAISNILPGDYCGMFLCFGLLPPLSALLSSPTATCQTKVCWALTTILTGPPRDIQAVIDCDLIPPLMRFLRDGPEHVKVDACWAIIEVANWGTWDQIRYLVSQGCIGPICGMLEQENDELVNAVLRGLCNILDAWEEMNHGDAVAVNECAASIEKAGGLQAILRLRYHPDDSVCKKVKRLAYPYLFSL